MKITLITIKNLNFPKPDSRVSIILPYKDHQSGDYSGLFHKTVITNGATPGMQGARRDPPWVGARRWDYMGRL